MGLLTDLMLQKSRDNFARQRQSDETQAQTYIEALKTGNLSPEGVAYANQQLEKLLGTKGKTTGQDSKNLFQMVGGLISRAHQRKQQGQQGQGGPPPPPGMTPTADTNPQPAELNPLGVSTAQPPRPPNPSSLGSVLQEAYSPIAQQNAARNAAAIAKGDQPKTFNVAPGHDIVDASGNVIASGPPPFPKAAPKESSEDEKIDDYIKQHPGTSRDDARVAIFNREHPPKSSADQEVDDYIKDHPSASRDQARAAIWQRKHPIKPPKAAKDTSVADVLKAQKDLDTIQSRYNLWATTHYVMGKVMANPYEEQLADAKKRLSDAQSKTSSKGTSSKPKNSTDDEIMKAIGG